MHNRTERSFYFRLIQIGVAEESKPNLLLFSLLIKFSETWLSNEICSEMCVKMKGWKSSLVECNHKIATGFSFVLCLCIWHRTLLINLSNVPWVYRKHLHLILVLLCGNEMLNLESPFNHMFPVHSTWALLRQVFLLITEVSWRTSD